MLKDISEGYPLFTFPSYVLQPGKNVRVYTNKIHPEYGGLSFGYGKAIWNNKDPDMAALYNTEGQEVFRKSYQEPLGMISTTRKAVGKVPTLTTKF